MTDKDFLQWIHDRLEHVHGENPRLDYMEKLRCVIESTNPETITPNMSGMIMESAVPSHNPPQATIT